MSEEKADYKTAVTSGVAHTPFQAWLNPQLARQQMTIADLANALNRDYGGIHRLARGNPAAQGGRHNVPSRPGWELAVEIGAAVGDVMGAVNAAGYDLLDVLAKHGLVVDVQTPSGDSIKAIVPQRYGDAQKQAVRDALTAAVGDIDS